MDAKFERLRQYWYHNMGVFFNIIEHLKQRETVFIKVPRGVVHRCLKINHSKYFFGYCKDCGTILVKKGDEWQCPHHGNTENRMMGISERYHFFVESHNLYGSLAHYPGLPNFSYNRETKREEMDAFNKNYLKYMTKFDFMIDLDNPKIGEALKQLIQIRDMFKKCNIPAWYLFSGTKGFHIRVDWDDFPDSLKQLPFPDLAEKFKLFGRNFALINKFDDLDVTIYDLRRITKIPYSVVYPYYFVALPLSDQDIDNFDLKQMSLPYNIQRIGDMRNRGVMKRPGNPEGFGKLIKEFTEI